MIRLLIDEHLSHHALERPLRDAGFDARFVDMDAELRSASDRELLAIAVRERRVVVTANVDDVMVLVGELAGTGRSHTGVILISSSVRTNDYGRILAGLRRLGQSPADDWTDRVVWLR